MFVGRVWASPVYDSDGRYLVHVGGSTSYTDDRDNAIRFRTRPEVHEGSYFVDTGDPAVDGIVGDGYFRLACELATVWGRFTAERNRVDQYRPGWCSRRERVGVPTSTAVTS